MSGSHAASACEINDGIVRGRCGFDTFEVIQQHNTIQPAHLSGEEGTTHDEIARVSEEELADLETLWPEIGVEPCGELIVAHGPLHCGSARVCYSLYR